jgi:hypothetical protein
MYLLLLVNVISACFVLKKNYNWYIILKLKKDNNLIICLCVFFFLDNSLCHIRKSRYTHSLSTLTMEAHQTYELPITLELVEK